MSEGNEAELTAESIVEALRNANYPDGEAWKIAARKRLSDEYLRWRVRYSGETSADDRLLLQELTVGLEQLPANDDGMEHWTTLLNDALRHVTARKTASKQRQDTLRQSIAVMSVTAALAAPLVAISLSTSKHEVRAGVIAFFGVLTAFAVAAVAGQLAVGTPNQKRGWRQLVLYGAPTLLGFVAAVLAARGNRSLLWVAWAGLAAMLVLAGARVWRYRNPTQPPRGPLLLQSIDALDSAIEYSLLISALAGRAAVLARAERRKGLAWATTYILVAVLAAVSAAAAGLAVLPASGKPSEVNKIVGLPPSWIAGLALAGAAATALSSGLNPGHEWKESAGRSRAFERLAREAETMRALDLPEYTSEKRQRAAVQYLLNKMDAIANTPGADLSFWTPKTPSVAGGPALAEPTA